MDATRFDTLIKSMTTGRVMRRGMLASVVTVLTALLSAPTTPDAAARKQTKRRKRRGNADRRERTPYYGLRGRDKTVGAWNRKLFRGFEPDESDGSSEQDNS